MGVKISMADGYCPVYWDIKPNSRGILVRVSSNEEYNTLCETCEKTQKLVSYEPQQHPSDDSLFAKTYSPFVCTNRYVRGYQAKLDEASETAFTLHVTEFDIRQDDPLSEAEKQLLHEATESGADPGCLPSHAPCATLHSEWTLAVNFLSSAQFSISYNGEKLRPISMEEAWEKLGGVPEQWLPDAVKKAFVSTAYEWQYICNNPGVLKLTQYGRGIVKSAKATGLRLDYNKTPEELLDLSSEVLELLRDDGGSYNLSQFVRLEKKFGSKTVLFLRTIQVIEGHIGYADPWITVLNSQAVSKRDGAAVLERFFKEYYENGVTLSSCQLPTP